MKNDGKTKRKIHKKKINDLNWHASHTDSSICKRIFRGEKITLPETSSNVVGV